MRVFWTLFIFALTLSSCESDNQSQTVVDQNWSDRIAEDIVVDSLETGRTYLSAYSQIYGSDINRLVYLSVTVSIRNTDNQHSIYIQTADYYDTHGQLIRGYTEDIVEVKPMETIEIFIDERSPDGGTGANFIFDWYKDAASNDPFFEAVMIATSGQQGISFTTQGIRLDESQSEMVNSEE